MIKILITDDHQLVIDGIKLMLAEVPDFQCVGEANNGEKALDFLTKTTPDVLLLDINMRGHGRAGNLPPGAGGVPRSENPMSSTPAGGQPL